MFFEIYADDHAPSNLVASGEMAPMIRYTWAYRQGSPDNPGVFIAKAYDTYPDEKATRSAIATTKKAFAASRMAKVITKETT